MQYEQIAEYERYIIKSLLDESQSLRYIARYLNRSPSTITREIQRNSGQRGYRPRQANLMAEVRKVSKRRYTVLTTEIKKQLRKLIKMKWSPEQISGWLLKEEGVKISILTIYRYIHFDKMNGGSLWTYLRQSSKKRRKRKGRGNNRGHIKNRVSIEERPAEVDEKKEIGHWEIDTMIGAHHKGVFVTIVERVSKFVLVAKTKGKTATEVTQKIIELLEPYKNKVKTITADNGKEFAGHEEFSTHLDASTYFARPYASYERGLNENTNGLLRQYFPKATDLRYVKEKSIIKAMKELNCRPRKTLGYLTPNDVFLN